MLHATETAKNFYKIVNIFYTIIFSENIFYTANNFYKSKLFLQYLFILFIFTRVASEAKRAKRAERNEVERVCGGEGGVLSASW